MNTLLKTIKTKGFTLTEVLVYVAILAIVSIVVVNAVLVSMGSFAAARSNRTLAAAALDSMERISREIRNAESVSVIGTSFDVDPGSLTLNTIDDGEPTTVVINVVDGSIMFSKNGETAEALFSSRVAVTSLIFNEIETARGVAVRITMTLQDVLGGTESATFYNTVGIRGSYSS